MEPQITINGVELTNAQAMTVRVALEDFSMTLTHEGLGDDDIGIAITNGYLNAIREIRKIILG